MQFNVASLLQEPNGTYREHDLDEDLLVAGAAHHLAGTARLDRTPRGIFVRARLHGEMDGECSRCLRPIHYPIDLSIEEEYIPTIDVASGARVEAPEDDADAYRIGELHVIDLSEAARQYWELSLPMAPVCDDDCAGLCPECGALIAAEGHTCDADHSDARWSKLANLKL